MKTTMEPSEDRATKQRRSFSGQEEAADTGRRQDALSQRIAAGPAMAAQRKVIDRIHSAAGPVQKQSAPEEDEELMQGKFVSQLQGPEEEEELMG